MATKDVTRREAPLARRRIPDFTDELIEPFTQLRDEVDRLFNRLPFRLTPVKLPHFAAAPALEMTETDKAFKITAEIPGIEPEKVDVTFDDGVLQIAGEKTEEREENERGYRFSERSYGAFERLITLPANANAEKIDARFKNGVLTVTIAKDGEEKRNVRRIKVNNG